MAQVYPLTSASGNEPMVFRFHSFRATTGLAQSLAGARSSCCPPAPGAVIDTVQGFETSSRGSVIMWLDHSLEHWPDGRCPTSSVVAALQAPGTLLV